MSTSLAGSMLGPYRIVTELGAGGMGTVWYGEHVGIGRRVAIKVLHPELSADHEPVKRFWAEARAVNAIRHPNIVDITDVGQEQGVSFLVMELLEGETLGARLERARTLELETAMRIVRQIALGLHAAHERGIVHRDLKPENVFICAHDDYPDRVKLLDFGIAKLTRTETGPGTRPGMIIGTPTYMSPEQCLGDRKLDSRADQYSLAIVMYEMLCGAPPFQAESFGRLLVCHSTQKPAHPCDRNEEVPRGVGDVLMRSLEKEPEDRYEDIRTFIKALDEAIVGQPEEPVAPVTQSRRDLERRQSFSVAKRLEKILRKRFAYGRAQLPAIPTVVADCLEQLNKRDADLGRVASSLERDPFVTSRLIRVVNSPAFGTRGNIASVQQAISRLGIKRTKSILLELSVRQVFRSRDPRIRLMFHRLWQHCVAVGTLARGVAHHIQEGPEPDVAYLAGLLHDVGKPIVAAYLLDAERQLMDSLGSSWMSDNVWLQVVERTHHEAGLALAGQWQLPDPVIEAMGHQDRFDYTRPRALSNLVLYANAVARVEGLDVGDVDLDAARELVIEGRVLLDLDDEVEAMLARELEERVHSMSAEEPASMARTAHVK